MRFKWILITVLVLLAVAGALALKEYLLLKKIQATFMTSPAKADSKSDAKSIVPLPSKIPLVDSVRITQDGQLVEARAGFAAFKKMVEQNPEVIRVWGRLGWKVLDNTPALCFRGLNESNPVAVLGVQIGECIITLDGETVNQPMRNLGIWMTLASRERIEITTLRTGRRITYRLRRR